MTNQTLLPIEKKYPERQVLPDNQVDWEYSVAGYHPPLFPEYDLAQARLAEAGLEVASAEELDALVGMSSEEATNEFGDAVAVLRNPLGRTGINGSGIYYVAGESCTADMAILREHSGNIQIATVYNRSKWSLPGGFCEADEKTARHLTALREAYEETGLDLSELADNGFTFTLRDLHVKENSRRSTDFGWLSNQVECVVLPDPKFGDAIQAGDDAEDAAWLTEREVDERRQNGLISQDHYSYMKQAFDLAAILKIAR